MVLKDNKHDGFLTKFNFCNKMMNNPIKGDSWPKSALALGALGALGACDSWPKSAKFSPEIQNLFSSKH